MNTETLALSVCVAVWVVVTAICRTACVVRWRKSSREVSNEAEKQWRSRGRVEWPWRRIHTASSIWTSLLRLQLLTWKAPSGGGDSVRAVAGVHLCALTLHLILNNTNPVICFSSYRIVPRVITTGIWKSCFCLYKEKTIRMSKYKGPIIQFVFHKRWIVYYFLNKGTSLQPC